MRGNRGVMRRIAPIATSLLLAGSAVLFVAGAWQRWATACPLGGDWLSDACYAEQDREVELWPGTPWDADRTAALMVGLGYLVLACAVFLLPAALAMRRPPLAVGGARRDERRDAVVVGGAMVLSALAGRLVEVHAYYSRCSCGLPAADRPVPPDAATPC